jgi:hypothetical protein
VGGLALFPMRNAAVTFALLIATVFLFASNTWAQEQKNLVGIELLGRAGLYSVNYERWTTFRVGLGAGLEYWYFGRDQHTFIAPLYISSNPIGDRHSLYLSAGATVLFSNATLFSNSRDYSSGALGTISGGYQFRSRGGFLIRPTVNYIFDGTRGVVWPGVTIGRMF